MTQSPEQIGAVSIWTAVLTFICYNCTKTSFATHNACCCDLCSKNLATRLCFTVCSNNMVPFICRMSYANTSRQTLLQETATVTRTFQHLSLNNVHCLHANVHCHDGALVTVCCIDVGGVRCIQFLLSHVNQHCDTNTLASYAQAWSQHHGIPTLRPSFWIAYLS